MMKSRETVGELHDPIRVLCIGRLIEYKGAYLAINALRHFPNTRLTLVGVGPYQATLEQLATGMEVTFAGFQNDTQNYYQETDIFIMPSLGPEGLPLVSLEAMANCLPCILSDLPVHKDITCDGETALLFRSGDSGDLAAKLRIMIEDRQARKRYALGGRRMFVQQFSPDAVRDRYLAIFGLRIPGHVDKGFRQNVNKDSQHGNSGFREKVN
jgi:glycosyltransferase involved in cell wall biosynthesis